MRFNSLLVRLDPEGKHRPLSKSFSEIPLRYDLDFEYNGWRCMGFHRGLDSMLYLPNSNLKSLAEKPASDSFTNIVDNQKLEK